MLAEAERQQYLHAMNIDVYVLRARVAMGAEAKTDSSVTTIDAAHPRLIIVYERADVNMHERQHAQIARSLGVTAAQIEWLDADAAQRECSSSMPQVWLVLGEHLLQVLDQQLSTQQQNALVIAVVPALPHAMLDGARKRALWQALKPLARALRTLAAGDTIIRRDLNIRSDNGCPILID